MLCVASEMSSCVRVFSLVEVLSVAEGLVGHDAALATEQKQFPQEGEETVPRRATRRMHSPLPSSYRGESRREPRGDCRSDGLIGDDKTTYQRPFQHSLGLALRDQLESTTPKMKLGALLLSWHKDSLKKMDFRRHLRSSLKVCTLIHTSSTPTHTTTEYSWIRPMHCHA